MAKNTILVTPPMTPDEGAAREMTMRLRSVLDEPLAIKVDQQVVRADFTTPMYLNHVAALEWWIKDSWGIA